LGLGAGWHEPEHHSYGIPFPKDKFARLEEQLAVITGLWETPVGETFSFDGEHYQIADSPALAKPAQERLPLLIGGKGAKRTPRLAARYASEFNVPFASLEEARAQYGRVRAAAEAVGRKPGELVYSSALLACVGKDDAEVARRAAAIGWEVDELKEAGLAGTPAEVVDKIGRYAEAGASRFYLQILDLDDLDHLALIAAQVQPQLG
jgi:alkanesulfonate monooxygenase SsuD/methylene tetrahydromethanopterin reductase-like flavin-dependent oxidoreductase (luciferase family)